MLLGLAGKHIPIVQLLLSSPKFDQWLQGNRVKNISWILDEVIKEKNFDFVRLLLQDARIRAILPPEQYRQYLASIPRR